MLQDDYKYIDNLNTFKNKIEKWKHENCPCRLCEFCIDNTSETWEQKRNSEYSVALVEVFLLPASIILLQVYTSFLTILTFNV